MANTGSRSTRGKMAAAAYIERLEMKILEMDYKTAYGTIPIIAIQGDDLVRVRVKTQAIDGPHYRAPTLSTIRRYNQQIDEYITVIGVPKLAGLNRRFDDISIRIIAEDRALLRHYRGI